MKKKSKEDFEKRLKEETAKVKPAGRKAEDKEQLTEWDKPKNNIESHWGNISYQTWCEMIAEEINKNPNRRAYVTTNEKGLVCVKEPLMEDGKQRWK